jgi:diguanylate cyclase (GGDEF)-like protein
METQTKFGLQQRINTVLIIATILLISIFIIIELQNQLAIITQHNLYRARTGILLVKNTLENVIAKNPENEARSIKNAIDSLQTSNVVDELVLISPDSQIVDFSANLLKPELDLQDEQIVKTIKKTESAGNVFQSKLSSQKDRLYLFVPIVDLQKNVKFIVRATFSLGNIKNAMVAVYKPAIFSTLAVIAVTIILVFLLSKTILGPIKVLNEATKTIAQQGKLDLRVSIETQDELQELAETFNEMTVALAKMKERAENANPLTKLPGNVVIREEVEKRISRREKFVVIHTDLDNFKAYNDKYGLAMGDEAIKLCADVIRKAVKEKGNTEDLVGHEGGDDFVVVTTPEKCNAITDYIVKNFDEKIKALYNEEDKNQGFIVSHARDGSLKQFPLMAISMAGATNAHRVISSYSEVTNITAEVKKKAKDTPGSVFIIDQRKA